MPWPNSIDFRGNLMRVAVSLLKENSGRILIAQRGDDRPHPGMWEFPGGKIEPGESPLEALKREIQEEVGLIVLRAEPFATVEHQYSDKSVELFVFLVSRFEGKAHKKDGQKDLKWVSLEQLPQFDFPKANLAIIERLRQEAYS